MYRVDRPRSEAALYVKQALQAVGMDHLRLTDRGWMVGADSKLFGETKRIAVNIVTIPDQRDTTYVEAVGWREGQTSPYEIFGDDQPHFVHRFEQQLWEIGGGREVTEI